jgi:hypothetical protein
MTIDEAARFVAGHAPGFPAAGIVARRDSWRGAYRAAAAKLHPDPGKDPAAWQRLQDAATLLNSLHNRK